MQAVLDDLVLKLSELYPSTDDARRIVDEAGLPAIFIDWGMPVAHVWLQVVRQAAARGRLEDLIKVAQRGFPGSEALNMLRGGLLYSGQSSDRMDSSVSPADDRDKLDEIWRMVYQVSERVSVLFVWMMALTLVGIAFATLVSFKVF